MSIHPKSAAVVISSGFRSIMPLTAIMSIDGQAPICSRQRDGRVKNAATDAFLFERSIRTTLDSAERG